VSWERISRKLAVIQALLVDLAEDLASLMKQEAGDRPVAEKRIGRKLGKGEKLELS